MAHERNRENSFKVLLTGVVNESSKKHINYGQQWLVGEIFINITMQLLLVPQISVMSVRDTNIPDVSMMFDLISRSH